LSSVAPEKSKPGFSSWYLHEKNFQQASSLQQKKEKFDDWQKILIDIQYGVHIKHKTPFLKSFSVLLFSSQKMFIVLLRENLFIVK